MRGPYLPFMVVRSAAEGVPWATWFSKHLGCRIFQTCATNELLSTPYPHTHTTTTITASNTTNRRFMLLPPPLKIQQNLLARIMLHNSWFV